MRRFLFLPLLFVCGLVACSGKSCSRSQALARVGSHDVTAADLAEWKRLTQQRDDTEALNALLRQELLAEGAVKAGLSQKADVAAQLWAAERAVLANAMLDTAWKDGLSERALRARYEAVKATLVRTRVHVRHLVVHRPMPVAGADADAQDQEARTRINGLHARVVGGESLEELARSASDDRVSALQNGELAPLSEGQVDPAFFEAAKVLRKGQVSAPVRSAVGYHIIEALEDPQQVMPSFEEVRGQLAADARQEIERDLLEDLAGSIKVKRGGAP